MDFVQQFLAGLGLVQRPQGKFVYDGEVIVRGKGEVTGPTPMGTFIQDVLQTVVPPSYSRYQAKRWLACELTKRLQAKEGFPSDERRAFVHNVLEQFNVHARDREVKKVWLVKRLHKLIEAFENQAGE